MTLFLLGLVIGAGVGVAVTVIIWNKEEEKELTSLMLKIEEVREDLLAFESGLKNMYLEEEE